MKLFRTSELAWFEMYFMNTEVSGSIWLSSPRVSLESICMAASTHDLSIYLQLTPLCGAHTSVGCGSDVELPAEKKLMKEKHSQIE